MKKLTVAMIARSMLVLIGRYRQMDYSGPTVSGDKIHIPGATQSTFKIWISPHDLLLSSDELSDKYFIPAVAPFLAKLIEHDAGVSHDLPLPYGRDSARHVYNGISMRCIITPTFSDPNLGDVFVPQEDWGKYEPTGYEIRFDIVHSRRQAMAA